MQYRLDPRSSNELSILGFGCMRFPRNLVKIDMEKTERLILKAIDQGINYFDTAYLYMGSEEALGEILHKHDLRHKVFIATKIPTYKCKTYDDFDRFFYEQLEHLKTDYIDYYFIHSLTELKTWNFLCELGIEKWIDEKKASGEIRQLGYSFHGTNDEFNAILDAYDWDFTQIQYNYVNINYQAGRSGLQKAYEKGIPVFIMEPLLGGKLATGLPKKSVKLFESIDATISPARWAFKWLWDQKEVTLVLSGMNDDFQLEDNVEGAKSALPGMLTDVEHTVFDGVIEAFSESYKIPCTGCNYCMPCPQNINIPACFTAYNMSFAVGRIASFQQYITSTNATDYDSKASASDCIKCGQCEKHCPQHIEIIKGMEDVKKKMEPFWFKPAMKVIGKVLT